MSAEIDGPIGIQHNGETGIQPVQRLIASGFNLPEQPLLARLCVRTDILCQ